MRNTAGAGKGLHMAGELVRFSEETGSTGGGLPPVLAGASTPAVAEQVGNFYGSIAALFEAWVGRRKSEHTRRAYRGDVMAFVEFMGWRWPDDAANLLRSSLLDVQAFKASIGNHGGAGKTINRRISSLSSFYKCFWPGPRLSCGSRSRCRIRHTLSSSRGNPPTRWTKRGRSPPSEPGN